MAKIGNDTCAEMIRVQKGATTLLQIFFSNFKSLSLTLFHLNTLNLNILPCMNTKNCIM
jgi:hypothetical protein